VAEGTTEAGTAADSRSAKGGRAAGGGRAVADGQPAGSRSSGGDPAAGATVTRAGPIGHRMAPRTGPLPRRPTMVDVAQRAGVSIKTVSRVVNNAPHVQQDLVDRVLNAVAELGFRRNGIARTLRSGRTTSTIGLVIEEIGNPFYSTIAAAVAEVAGTHETMLITASSEEDPDREQQLLLDLCSRRVDGLIVVPAAFDHGFLRGEVEMGLPVVFLDRPSGGLHADTVLLDNRGGAHAGVRHLIGQGHRRIAILLDSMGVYTMRERLTGAQEAMTDAGIPYDAAMIRDQVHDPDSAARTVGELLAAADPPTAFFSTNNRITVGIIEELWRRGDDSVLVGFDDFELSHLMPRPFTVIGYDTREYGRQAAQLLFRRIDGDRSWPTTTVLPTHLLPRGLPG
jgi:LacI family transcriptional regulator